MLKILICTFLILNISCAKRDKIEFAKQPTREKLPLSIEGPKSEMDLGKKEKEEPKKEVTKPKKTEWVTTDISLAFNEESDVEDPLDFPLFFGGLFKTIGNIALKIPGIGGLFNKKSMDLEQEFNLKDIDLDNYRNLNIHFLELQMENNKKKGLPIFKKKGFKFLESIDIYIAAVDLESKEAYKIFIWDEDLDEDSDFAKSKDWSAIRMRFHQYDQLKILQYLKRLKSQGHNQVKVWINVKVDGTPRSEFTITSKLQGQVQVKI